MEEWRSVLDTALNAAAAFPTCVPCAAACAAACVGTFLLGLAADQLTGLVGGEHPRTQQTPARLL